MSSLYLAISAWREILARTFAGFTEQDNVSPDWLVNPATRRKLKLDKYYPDAGIAVRFIGLTAKGQGRQSDWEVMETEQRDQTRAELCRQNGVQLATLDPNDDLVKQLDGLLSILARVLNLVTLALILLAGLSALLAEPIVRYILAPGFSPEQQVLTAALMRGMLLGTVVFGASGLVMGALNATQHFVAPAAAPVLYNLAIILAAYFLAPSLGIYGLVTGVVAGSLAHFLVQLPALWRKGAEYHFSISLRDRSVRTVLKLMGPRVLGLFFVQMHFLVNTILASGLAAGSLSALNYGFLLMLLPQGIIAQAIATAAFPTFSAQYAAGQHAMLRRSVSQTLRTVLFLSLPAAAMLFVLDRATIGLLFEHGEFTQRSTELVVFALQFYLLGLVAHSALEIIVRAFYAVQNTLTPVMVGVAAMIANIGLSLVLVRPLSFGGLALANSIATTLEMLLLLWLLRRRLGGIQGRSLALTVLRSALATAAMAGVLALWVQWAPTLLPDAQGGDWLTASGGIVIGMGVYCLASWALRSEELAVVFEMVKQRGGRTHSPG